MCLTFHHAACVTAAATCNAGYNKIGAPVSTCTYDFATQTSKWSAPVPSRCSRDAKTPVALLPSRNSGEVSLLPLNTVSLTVSGGLTVTKPCHKAVTLQGACPCAGHSCCELWQSLARQGLCCVCCNTLLTAQQHPGNIASLKPEPGFGS